MSLRIITAGKCSCQICLAEDTTDDKINNYQYWIANSLVRTDDITRVYDLIEELQVKSKEEQLARLGNMDIFIFGKSAEFYQSQIDIADDVLSKIFDDLTDDEILEIDEYIQIREKLLFRIAFEKSKAKTGAKSKKPQNWKKLDLITLGEIWEEVIFVHKEEIAEDDEWEEIQFIHKIKNPFSTEIQKPIKTKNPVNKSPFSFPFSQKGISYPIAPSGIFAGQ